MTGAAPASARVLVIDDEPMMLRAFRRLIEKEYELVCAADPRQAIAAIRGGERFDAIFCDMLMPATTGMQVYAEVQQIDEEQARRIVFMTGGAFTPEVLDFLDAVENARIEKPVERASLRAAIRALMTR